MADFDYLPEGLWGDEYRDAGGVVVPDFLRQQAQQRQSMADLYTGEPEAPPEPPAPEQEFYDWPKYHALVGGKLKPYEAYDEYVSIALPQQLKDMGYSDDEIRQGVAQFTQMVPAPAADYGTIGNLWESAKQGFASGTRAEKATGNMATGNLDAIAKLFVEQTTGPRPTAPNQAFTESRIGGDANSGLWESVKAFAGAAYDNPEGALNAWVEQMSQSYPSIVGGAAGFAGGMLASPLGALVGGALGAGAGSASTEVGSQILERIATEAQNRGVDPRDAKAILAMIQDPEVYSQMRNAAVAKGLTVGAFDAAVASMSIGLGKAATTAARGGRGLRATGLAGTGVAAEGVGSSVGEAASQIAAGDKLNYPDIAAEGMFGVGPGAMNVALGHFLPQQTQPGAVPSANPPIEPDLDEGGLAVNNTEPIEPPPLLTPNVMRGRPPPGFGVTETPGVEEITVPPVQGATPFEQMEVGELTTEEITIEPAQFVDSAEARIAEGRLLTFQPNAPLVADSAGQVGTPQQMEQQRLSQLTTPQATDLNIKDANSVAQWLEDRGVVLTPTQHAIAEDLAGTPPRQRREYIASVIDDLIASPDANAESLAHGLLAIANTLPKDPAPKPADAAAAAAVALKVPVEDVPKAAVSLLMQEMAAAIESGVTNATETQGPAAPAAPTTAAGATVARRGLRRGEPLPGNSLADLVHDIAGSGAVERAQTPQKQSRGGLRSRVAQEGAGQRGKPLARAEAAAPGQGPGSARTVAVDTSGAPGVPRVIRGLRYGAQETDVANAESLAAEREAARARKQTGGLSKKAKKGLSRKVVTKKEYEETYPGRDLDKDVDELFDNPIDWESQTPLSESAKRTIESAPFSSVMEYLSAVMSSPLQRRVAERIRDLDIAIPIRVAPVSGTQSGVYTTPSVLPGRKTNVGITIDPRKASLKTVLHEAVHAATVSALRYPQTAEQRAAGQRMRELHEYVSKQPGAQAHYGVNQERGEIGTVEEFVAEAFSNPEFQKYLNSLQLPNAPKKVTAWTAFKQFVMDLIGRPTVLSEVLIHGEDLFSAEQRGAGSALFDQPRAAPSTAIIGAKDGVRAFIAYAKNKDDPNTKFTLYPTTNNLAGDKDAGIPNLTREQVREYIESQGGTFVAPTADTQIKKGVPKNSATKLVGFDPNGELRAAGYEQKNGTWTYYQSDADVRTDPNAKVTKDLTKDAVQRYIAHAGYLTEAPTPNAVKPAATSPTNVGYAPASEFRTEVQDIDRPIKAMGDALEQAGVSPLENPGMAATLRNSENEAKYKQVLKQYITPVKEAGNRISKRFGKTPTQIESTLQQMHTVERMATKIRQTYKGSDDEATQAGRVADYTAKQDAAQAKINAERNSNPTYFRAVQQEFAPLWKRMTDNNTDLAVQYGRMDRDTGEQIKRAYDYYVPLQVGDKTTTGKVATGANVQTDRSFARVVEQTQRIIQQGEQNRVVQMVADVVKKYGVVDKATNKPTVLIGDGIKVAYDEETNSLSEQVDSHTFDSNTVFFWREGQRIPMTMVADPALLTALQRYKGADRSMVLAGIMATSAAVNRLVAVGKTSLSPIFAFANFFRDVQTANVNMPSGVSRVKFNTELLNLRNYASVVYNVARDLFGAEPTGAYKDAQAGLISHRNYVSLPEIANDLDTMMRPTRSLKGINALRKRAQTKTFEALSMLSQIAESIPRVAMYRAAYDSGKARGMSDGEAKLYASNAAKNASVNFEQRGKYNLSSWWIFGNAKMQGVTALGDSAKRMGPTKAILGTVGLVALGTLAAALQYEWSDKDKDGKSKALKVPNYKKDGQLYFKVGDFALPISQELSVFYTLGHALMELKMGAVSLGETASRIFTSVLNQAWPGNVPQQEVAGYKANPIEFAIRAVLPSGLAPGVDLATGRNTWGSEIVPDYKEKKARGVPPSEMGSAEENQLASNLKKNGLLSQGTSKLMRAAPTLVAQSSVGMGLAPQELKLINNYFNPLSEPYAFVRDLMGDREVKYPGDVVNPFERRFTAQATVFYDQDKFNELLAKSARAKYLAEHNGIDTLEPEDQVLARSAGMLSKIQADIKSSFKGNALMTTEKRKLLSERANERVLEGIRRYNEARDRAIPKQ